MEEKVFIKNKSGLSLAVLIDRPVGDERCPVVIILGGLIEYKEHARLELLAKALVKRGIGAVRFDPSGYGESGGTLENDYRLSNCIEDTQAVFEYITNLSWVDKERVGVSGESMGGIQALVLAKNNKSSIKSLVLISTPIIVGSDDDLKDKYQAWEKDGYSERISSKYGKLRIPFDFILDARQWSALDYLEGINAPILVVWCSNDTNVPPQITKKIFENAIGPKEFRIIKNADHFLNKDPKLIGTVTEHISNFLVRKLK